MLKIITKLSISQIIHTSLANKALHLTAIPLLCIAAGELYRHLNAMLLPSDLSYGPTKPASVNRELAVFKTIFAKAIKNDKAEENPAQGVKL